MLKHGLPFSLLFFLFFNANSQDKKMAARYFEAGNFESALDEYLLLLEKNPHHPIYNYRAGVCFLNTNIDKSKAIPHFEILLKQKKYDPNTLYLLGRAYHFNYEFDKAIDAYDQFLNQPEGSPENRKDAGKQIEYCENAKELMKFPVKVRFENLGDNVNSVYPDYFPFTPVDESFILFNSRRNDGSETRSTGNFYSNIYYAEKENGKYSRAVPVPGVNDNASDDCIVGLSNNGQIMIKYDESSEGISDLYYVIKQNGAFTKRTALDQQINTRFTEIAASISADSNSIFFASNMPGGYGGIDLYVCRRLPNGEWSKAQNLGPSVNTIYDEDFPSVSPDGNTLYFSSKGHTSMGGYDIFIAEFDSAKERFMHVRNIGFPINTPADDMNFRPSADGNSGYISAVRKDGFGDLDIYRVVFEEKDVPLTVYKGYVKLNQEDGQKIRPSITLTRSSDGEIVGTYVPNQKTGRYVMILEPGTYMMEVEAEGYEMYTWEFEVKNMSDDVFEYEKDIIMKK